MYTFSRLSSSTLLLQRMQKQDARKSHGRELMPAELGTEIPRTQRRAISDTTDVS